MLDEKKEEIKLRIWQRPSHRHHMPLLMAKRVEEAEREFSSKYLNEPLELTEEEKLFKAAWEAELGESIRLSEAELEEINKKRTKKWWYIYAKIYIKEDINEMKENYRIALAAQETICNELITKAENEENEEWFTTLTPENRVKARVALKEQRRILMKLQNEILEIWEEELIRLQSSIKDFPFID